MMTVKFDWSYYFFLEGLFEIYEDTCFKIEYVRAMQGDKP